MSDDGWLICDHCESSMDDPIEGIHGKYCTATCFYAEEIDGVAAHGDAGPCPGCEVSDT